MKRGGRNWVASLDLEHRLFCCLHYSFRLRAHDSAEFLHAASLAASLSCDCPEAPLSSAEFPLDGRCDASPVTLLEGSDPPVAPFCLDGCLVSDADSGRPISDSGGMISAPPSIGDTSGPGSVLCAKLGVVAQVIKAKRKAARFFMMVSFITMTNQEQLTVQ